MRPGRKKVEWKVPPVKRLRARPLLQEIPLRDENEWYSERLTTGALFFVGTPLRALAFYSDYEQPPHPYLTHHRDGSRHTVAPAGTLAVYAGSVRVEELSRKGMKVFVLRHSFVIGGARYLTTDLNCFVPA